MDGELVCTLCEEEYQEDNPPRLLTGCGHSYCESCLKKIMTEKKGCFKIVCPEDGEMVTLKDNSVTNFPKNIALLKIIESKNTNLSFKDSSLEVSKIAKNDEAQEDEDARDLVDAIISSKNATTSDDNIQPQEESQSQPPQPQVQMCLLHQKPLEVVCVIDLKKICANCAIFGQHKGHEFKSLEEIQCERMDYYTSIIDIMDKKETISTRISNEETRSSIMEILQNKKEKMRKSISEKYKKLLEAIEQKQAQSLKNLSSVIQKTEAKLNNLMNIDPNILEKYDTWEAKSYNQIKILEGDDFEAKLQLLFLDNSGETEDVIEEGDKILEQMNRQEENLISQVEGALQNIGLEFNQEIFNHIEGFVEIFDEAKKKKTKRVAGASKAEKSEVSSVSLSKPPQKKQETLPFQQPTKPNVGNKTIGDVTHHTSSENPNQTANNERIVSSIIQMHADQDLLEQEEAEIKKPEFVKQEEPQKSFEKVEQPSPISERKREERPMQKSRIQSQKSPPQTQRSNKKDVSFEKIERPNKKKLSKVKVPEKYEKVIQGIVNDTLELVDLTNAQLGDAAIAVISEFINGSKVKTVKFIRNKLNDDTIGKILPYMGGVITLNLSQNLLTDKVLDILIAGRDYMPSMKSVILSQNKIIERKHKTKIDKLRSLDITVSV